MKILIVDDEEVSLTLLETILTQAGYEVVVAWDGAEALEKAQSQGIRLIVSDWEMPRLSGPDLCKVIRSQDFGGYTYIVLVTSHDTPEARVQGLAAGADDFLSKPYNSAELIERIHVAERILSLETRDVAIFAMAKLAESRDPETGSHLERVRSYSRALAQDLAGVDKFRSQINGQFIRLIYLTSPLHDIGKVGIPDSVLLKPGRLSDKEFQIMKTHTTLGAETLGAAYRQFPGVRFLEMGRDIAATHHERWDGGGYPAGLSGEQIPLCGRIVALADVYDALTSKRVYKDAFAHDVARSIILKESGQQFDKDIVAAFERVETEFLGIRARYDQATAEAIAA
jgi:putative two-component system response regulator